MNNKLLLINENGYKFKQQITKFHFEYLYFLKFSQKYLAKTIIV